MGNIITGNTNTIARFYRYYAEVSNDGVVFDLDLSERTDLGFRRDERTTIFLTADEVKERLNWNYRKLKQIYKYYNNLKFRL
jgi:hypothetical protein